MGRWHCVGGCREAIKKKIILFSLTIGTFQETGLENTETVTQHVSSWRTIKHLSEVEETGQPHTPSSLAGSQGSQVASVATQGRRVKTSWVHEFAKEIHDAGEWKMQCRFCL